MRLFVIKPFHPFIRIRLLQSVLKSRLSRSPTVTSSIGRFDSSSFPSRLVKREQTNWRLDDQQKCPLYLKLSNANCTTSLWYMVFSLTFVSNAAPVRLWAGHSFSRLRIGANAWSPILLVLILLPGLRLIRSSASASCTWVQSGLSDSPAFQISSAVTWLIGSKQWSRIFGTSSQAQLTEGKFSYVRSCNGE